MTWLTTDKVGPMTAKYTEGVIQVDIEQELTKLAGLIWLGCRLTSIRGGWLLTDRFTQTKKKSNAIKNMFEEWMRSHSDGELTREVNLHATSTVVNGSDDSFPPSIIPPGINRCTYHNVRLRWAICWRTRSNSKASWKPHSQLVGSSNPEGWDPFLHGW